MGRGRGSNNQNHGQLKEAVARSSTQSGEGELSVKSNVSVTVKDLKLESANLENVIVSKDLDMSKPEISKWFSSIALTEAEEELPNPGALKITPFSEAMKQRVFLRSRNFANRVLESASKKDSHSDFEEHDYKSMTNRLAAGDEYVASWNNDSIADFNNGQAVQPIKETFFRTPSVGDQGKLDLQVYRAEVARWAEGEGENSDNSLFLKKIDSLIEAGKTEVDYKINSLGYMSSDTFFNQLPKQFADQVPFIKAVLADDTEVDVVDEFFKANVSTEDLGDTEIPVHLLDGAELDEEPKSLIKRQVDEKFTYEQPVLELSKTDQDARIVSDQACDQLVQEMNKEDVSYKSWVSGPTAAGLSNYLRSVAFHYKEVDVKFQSSVTGAFLFKKEHVDFKLEGPREQIAYIMDDLISQIR